MAAAPARASQVAPLAPPSLWLRAALRLTTAPPRSRLAQAVMARMTFAELATEETLPQGWEIRVAGPTWDSIWQSYPGAQTRLQVVVLPRPRTARTVPEDAALWAIILSDRLARQHDTDDDATAGQVARARQGRIAPHWTRITTPLTEDDTP